MNQTPCVCTKASARCPPTNITRPSSGALTRTYTYILCSGLQVKQNNPKTRSSSPAHTHANTHIYILYSSLPSGNISPRKMHVGCNGVWRPIHHRDDRIGVARAPRVAGRVAGQIGLDWHTARRQTRICTVTSIHVTQHARPLKSRDYKGANEGRIYFLLQTLRHISWGWFLLWVF